MTQAPSPGPGRRERRGSGAERVGPLAWLDAGSPRAFAWSLTACFLLAAGFVAFHHEMWRDELEGWLLARESATVGQLIHNTKYLEHPILWYLCLMPLAYVTRSPVGMQGLHLVVAAATVYLFARHAPFTRLQKALFAFGYFPFYEYAIVCRQYALALLLIVALAAAFPARHTHPLWVGSLLFLLCQTSLHGVIVAIALGATLVWELVFVRTPRRSGWLAVGLLVAGTIASVLKMRPEPGWAGPNAWVTTFDAGRLKEALGTVGRGFLPVPKANLDFYLEQWLDTAPSFAPLRVPFAMLVLTWCALVVARRPLAFVLYAVGSLGLLAFFYSKLVGYTRHHGFLFVLFLAAAWIAHLVPFRAWPEGPDRVAALVERSSSPVLTGLLLVHVAGGAIAARMDVRYVFSHAKATAQFIKARGLESLPMVGEPDFATQAVLAYLEKDRAYYPRADRFGSFPVRDGTNDTGGGEDDDVVERGAALQRLAHRDVLLVLNRPLKTSFLRPELPEELLSLTGSACGLEDYHVYRLDAVLAAQERASYTDLMRALKRSTVEAPSPVHVLPLILPVGGEERRTLFMHAPSSVEFPPVAITSESTLQFGIGISQEAWKRGGDGVLFSVFVRDGAGDRLRIYSRYLDPVADPRDRAWVDVRVPLSAFAGREVRVTLETTAGQAGKAEYDWSGWSRPIVFREACPPPSSAGALGKVKGPGET